MSSTVKEGYVQRYTAYFFYIWKSNYAVLYSNSTLSFFKNKGDESPVKTVVLKNVVPYICVGFMCDWMRPHHSFLLQVLSVALCVYTPSRPQITVPVQRLVGIGMDPRASKVHWILFQSENILEEWINAIISTLPPPSLNPVGSSIPPVTSITLQVSLRAYGFGRHFATRGGRGRGNGRRYSGGGNDDNGGGNTWDYDAGFDCGGGGCDSGGGGGCDSCGGGGGGD
uniref:PH domain-containing protein n=1 Tax=Meloidogyne enterolobii TaxID=390850 RepID=A0A6V7UWT4_MELEN|nr:unnamed protein product [Meloidogyne enterolobii]